MTETRPTLMLVDDEPDILLALQDLFEDRYRVIAYTSPARALDALSDEPDVAVIVSDQRMPDMTGDAFLARAREMSDAAAILLTGYADLSAVTAALNSGGIVGYAPKPWEPDALRAMVAGAAEQHVLRRALRQEQALLRGLMESLPAAIAFKDVDGRLLQVNARKARAMGLEDPGEGRTEEEITGAPRRPAEPEAVASRRAIQVVTESTAEVGRAWTETTVAPILDDAGDVVRLLVVERDVTDQRMAEIQLRQSDKLRALGTLAGGVAHDFNNLLTAILGSLELAARRLGDEQAVRRYLDNATLAAQKGAVLTQRLLGFSRQGDSRPEVVDLHAVLSGTRDLVARTLGGGVRVEWRIADDLWRSAIESDQFELALLNLAVNARDAIAETGEITIEARNVSLAREGAVADLAAGDYVAVSVRDTGSGMSPDVLNRILEPFFTTKPVGKGTGLGLPMVYGFAQRSGGALEIDSEPGRGTEVVLYLPRAAAEPAGAADGDGELAGPTAGGRKIRILVVDDEPGVRSVTAAFLSDLGHEVLQADGGPSALALLRENPGQVDLALVDFAMPAMNGVEFAEQARAAAPDLPVILLTGYFDVEAVPSDVAIMHKPFTNSTLQTAIARALPPLATTS